MMRRFCLLLTLMLCTTSMSWGHDVTTSVACHADSPELPAEAAVAVAQQSKQSVKQRITQRINDKLNEPYDTTRDSRYWWRALKHGKIDFNDTTIHYPKFIRFCWNTYKWGDRTFNSYDSTYVVGTGKNWKLILKTDNWVDSYIGRPLKNINMIMNSNLVSNVGASLSFMAVSLGYSVNVSNMMDDANVSNKVDFSFTCARFAADAYYWENNNKTNVIYTNKAVDDVRHKFKQSGISRKAKGVTAYYFFNNRRYAQAAAYCFSKYQKRSAGSWLAGISLQHFDVKFDLDQMLGEAHDYIASQEQAPRILYNDYCLLFGYGHNWVLGKKWLLNLTVTPYFGYRYNMSHQVEEGASALSLNLRGRMGAVYNHRQFFIGLQGYADHHRYKTKNSRLVNSVLDFQVLCGVRF